MGKLVLFPRRRQPSRRSSGLQGPRISDGLGRHHPPPPAMARRQPLNKAYPSYSVGREPILVDRLRGALDHSVLQQRILQVRLYECWEPVMVYAHSSPSDSAAGGQQRAIDQRDPAVFRSHGPTRRQECPATLGNSKTSFGDLKTILSSPFHRGQ